ncbi:MAG: GGDEF domain-containing protein [Thermoanaerobaculaceae bacterium]|nr:GGDEF domain-containing protein [Thermoanaerobaculaceae bacterium]
MGLGSIALGRLAVAAQLVVVLLCALFFLVLSRSIQLRQVRLWAIAWWADAAALSAVFAFVFVEPPLLPPRLGMLLYTAGKTVYALLIVAGARHHLRPGVEVNLPPAATVLLVSAWSLAVGLLAPRLVLVQLGQCVMVAGLLGFGGVWVLRRPRHLQSLWLGVALLAEAALFAHYVPLLAPTIWGGQPVTAYTAYSSFWDAGAEIFMALSILVALGGSSAEFLHHINAELEASQERLRQLVDLDPLTNLANRRGLRAVLERMRAGGAAIVFLDIDDFKLINDRLGHIAGDECLKRLARALPRFFRPDDYLFRWGGDEFLVVAPGMDEEGARQRVLALSAALATPGEEGPVCTVSAGVSVFPPGGDPDTAIHEADRRMYTCKRPAR